MKQATLIDIRQFIDDQPFGRYQLRIVTICGVLVFMDGFDAQAMGFVAPALMAQLHITRAALGPAISTGLLGMMIGALFCGPLADHFGRKPVLVGCALTFGLGSLLTATATSLESLLIFRLLTGLGLGGAMPNAIALTSEYAPKRIRATAVMTMFTGFSIGAAVGGFLAAGLISRFGWQSIFVIGGILPLLIAIVSVIWLPESLRFLIAKGANGGANGGANKDKIASYLARISPNGGPFDAWSVGEGETRPAAFVVKELFAEGRAGVTLLLWVLFFMNLLVLYFLNSWLPTTMHDSGIKVETAIIITTLFQVGGAVGAILLGRFFDRAASFGLLAAIYCGATATIFLIGEVGASITLLALTVFVAGFCVIGGQTGSNALTAEFYPTAIRSTGIGWALGIGRIGSVIGPTLGGVLLSMGGETRHVFWAASIPAFIATLAALAIAFSLNKQRVGMSFSN